VGHKKIRCWDRKKDIKKKKKIREEFASGTNKEDDEEEIEIEIDLNELWNGLEYLNNNEKKAPVVVGFNDEMNDGTNEENNDEATEEEDYFTAVSGMIEEEYLPFRSLFINKDKLMMDENTVAEAGLLNDDLLFVAIIQEPALHCFNQCYAWEILSRHGLDALSSHVDRSVQCRGIDTAPEVGRKVAEALAEMLEEGDGGSVVISNPGNNLVRACAKALGLLKHVHNCAILEVNFAEFYRDEIEARTVQMLCEQLTGHFLFCMDELSIFSGGYAADGSVVGFI